MSLSKILAGVSRSKTCKPLEVTKDQYESLEALVVAYMCVAKVELPMTQEKILLSSLDEQFDRILKVVDDAPVEDTYEEPANPFRENTRYLWEDTPIGACSLTTEELEDKYSKYREMIEGNLTIHKPE